MAENLEQTKKRVRSVNYTTEEKCTLINIVSKYKNIIESKKTDKVTWKDKNDTWATIANEFNAIIPNGIYRTIDSLKKFYDNMKKETRKIAAQEKMELFKTGGGRPAHKVSDPMHDSILALMNTKTVKGLNNNFDSDTTYTVSDASNILDNMTNNILCISNESNTDTEECIMYEALDEDYFKDISNTNTIHDVDVISISMNKIYN